MRADAFLRAAEALPVRDLATVSGGGGIVVLAPHPDDESLGCGGLIAQACDRGIPVRLVVLSDGVGSHPNSRSHPAERLRTLREAETRDAVRALGLPAGQVTFLRLPDRFVPAAGPGAEEAADRIAGVAAACGARALLATWAHDPHCDHAAAAAIARLVRDRRPGLRLLAYPVWGWTLPPGQDVGAPPAGLRLGIDGEVARKNAAVAAHRSQVTDLIADDPEGFRLSPAMLARFARPFEIYLEVPA